MTMLARIAARDANSDRRRTNRRILRLQVASTVSGFPGEDVLIHDLSSNGLLLETSAELAIGDKLEVELPEAARAEARVMWCDGRYFGCQFDSSIPAAALSAAQLRNPPRAPALQPASAELSELPVAQLPFSTRLQLIGALALGAWVLVLTPIALASGVFY